MSLQRTDPTSLAGRGLEDAQTWFVVAHGVFPESVEAACTCHLFHLLCWDWRDNGGCVFFEHSRVKGVSQNSQSSPTSSLAHRLLPEASRKHRGLRQ